MTKTVLIPVDFSDVSSRAIHFFEELEATKIDRVILLHVLNERNYKVLEEVASFDVDEFTKKHTDSAKENLERIAQRLRNRGNNVDLKVVFGVPFREILQAEIDYNASLIVIGSHGRSNIAEMIIGSVAEKIVRKARSPVLLVKR
ncbi:MAG: universal stress protein [Dissulfuribacterales bacterium]